MATTLDPAATDVLGRYLTEGETLLWCGQPHVYWSRELRRILPSIGFLLCLFSLIFFFNLSQVKTELGSATLTENPPVQVEKPPDHKSGGMTFPDAIFLSVFLTVFLSFWAYFMFRGLGGERLLYALSFAKSYYGLTDHRLIVVTGRKEVRILSYHLRTLQDLRLHEQPDGIGTIQMGPQPPFQNPFQKEEVPPAILKSVPQAAHVFGLICQAQHRLINH